MYVSLQERHKVIPIPVGAGTYQRVEIHYTVCRDTTIV
jgi:ABC-type ATPase involved in cell division